MNNAPSHNDSIPASVAEAFDIDPLSAEPLAGGHINLTFAARRLDGARCVLQRVNPIFPATVNIDIDVVSRHLTGKGHASPRILRTRSGDFWTETPGGVWRALSFVDGATTETLGSFQQARAAGTLLGRFHAALADLEHDFLSVRSDPHDTPRHLKSLAQALQTHVNHPRFVDVEPLALKILEVAGSIQPLPPGPMRVVHGDPKISNLLFDRQTGDALCLVDLDTLGRRSLATELGDAFRSWCNPAGEDAADAGFSLDLFAAAVAGYAHGSRGLLTSAEHAAIPAAVETIGIELAARFCADALHESFFRWDRQRFTDATAHNLARAGAQLSVALAAARARDAMHEIVAAAFTARAMTQL